jgi:hypothetical protein
MIEKKVDMFSAKNIAVIATIMIIGLVEITASAEIFRSSALKYRVLQEQPYSAFY